jgi:hypothetical protein
MTEGPVRRGARSQFNTELVAELKTIVTPSVANSDVAPVNEPMYRCARATRTPAVMARMPAARPYPTSGRSTVHAATLTEPGRAFLRRCSTVFPYGASASMLHGVGA